MPEIPNVIPDEPVEAQWGNQIRDRSLQRYDDYAAMQASVPSPQDGSFSFLEFGRDIYTGYANQPGSRWKAIAQASGYERRQTGFPDHTFAGGELVHLTPTLVLPQRTSGTQLALIGYAMYYETSLPAPNTCTVRLQTGNPPTSDQVIQQGTLSNNDPKFLPFSATRLVTYPPNSSARLSIERQQDDGGVMIARRMYMWAWLLDANVDQDPLSDLSPT